jgi:hypothetical protein
LLLGWWFHKAAQQRGTLFVHQADHLALRKRYRNTHPASTAARGSKARGTGSGSFKHTVLASDGVEPVPRLRTLLLKRKVYNMDSQNILPVQQSAPAGTGATTIIGASGQANRYHHLVSLIITTANAVAGTLTISDGSKTVAILNYPNAASAPAVPLVFQPTFPVEQSSPNLAWTITPSANASGYNVTAQYVEN